jgi:histidyl-tRNA synthetase
VVIIGEDELKANTATVKNMLSGEQETVPQDQLKARLQ